MTASDESLLQRYAETRDERAFDALVERHWDTAYRMSRRCLNQDAAAEDTAQEVFFRLSRASTRQLQLRGAFLPWFRTLVLNAVRDGVKKSRRRTHYEQRASRRDRVSDRADQAALRGEVRAQIAALPHDVRGAIVLRYMEDLSHSEVAEVLGCKPGTASSRIRRGLEQLREALAGAGAAGLATPGLETLLRGLPAAPAPPAPKGLARAARRSLPWAALAATAAALVGGVILSVFALPGEGDLDQELAAGPAPDGDAPAAAPETEPQAVDRPAPPPQQPGANPSAPGDEGEGGDVGPKGDAPRETDATTARVDSPRAQAPTEAEIPFPRAISGQVLEQGSLAPLQGARVVALPQFREAGGTGGRSSQPEPSLTDASGAFRIPLEAAPAGHVLESVTVAVYREGHAPFARTWTRGAGLDRPLGVLLERGADHAARVRVVDPAGAPMPDFELHLSPPMPIAAQGLLVGEAALPEGTTLERLQYFPSLARRTDDEGLLALGGLPREAAGRATAFVRDSRFEATAYDLATAARPPETLIQLRVGAALVVELVDAAGRPAEGYVEVGQASSRAGGTTSGWALNGRFTHRRAAPGRYRISVGFSQGAGGREAARDRAHGIADRQLEVELERGVSQTVRVEAPPPGSRALLTARLVDSTGAPAAAREVWVARATDPDWLNSLRLATDGQGLARFELPAGRYKLQSWEDASGAPQAEVELGQAGVEVRLSVPSQQVLTGVVRDAQGAPVAEAMVSGVVFKQGSSIDDDCLTDAEGRFSLTLPEGHVMLGVEREGYQYLDESVFKPEGPLELTLQTGQSLVVVGQVPDSVGAGTELELTWRSADGFSVRSVYGEVAGGGFRVEISGLDSAASGSISVRVGETLPTERTLSAGEFRVDLGLVAARAGCSIRGRVSAPEGWLSEGTGSVYASIPGDRDGWLASGSIEQDGSFELGGLPAGAIEVQLTVYSPQVGDNLEARAKRVLDASLQQDLGLIELEVSDPSSVVISGFRVEITDLEGDMAKMGFVDGDRVVAMDGKPLTERALQEAFEGDSPTMIFGVLRDGEPVDVAVDREVMFAGDPTTAGGRMLPE